jgi:hypothetical protein
MRAVDIKYLLTDITVKLDLGEVIFTDRRVELP